MLDQILSILRDAVWQAVFGFFAIVVTILLFIADRQRKELSLLAVSQPDYPIKMDDGKTVPVRRYVIKLINSGKVPILPSDFERPARIYIHRSIILEATIVDNVPGNMHPDARLKDGDVIFLPLLLNPRDSITFEVKYADVYGRMLMALYNEAYVDARIAGVAAVRRLDYRFGCLPLMLILVGFLVFVSTSFLEEFTAIPNSVNDWSTLRYYTGLTGAMLMIIGWFRNPWTRMWSVETTKTRIKMFFLWFGWALSRLDRWAMWMLSRLTKWLQSLEKHD